MKEYNIQRIEKRWQRTWKRTRIYQVPDRISGKKNFYHLVMFPYSSGDLHLGHWYNFAPADVYARYKRMQGLNVMSPIGFDAFGLPAENAALSHGIHPKTWTYRNIERMGRQLRLIGAVYDWSREIITCDPEYYKWTQWMFLQLYKANLVYRAKVPANWCPSCKTVLANEQVIEGRCERCNSQVVQKEIEQWLFKISAYAEDLLKDLENLDWPETTKIMQRNWIGRSEGWEIKFQIPDSKFKIPVFTTRADTLFGCTYLVLAPEHPLIKNLESRILNLEFVENYIRESKKKTERERISEMKEKTGIQIKGIKAINPVNGREIPIFVADYVLRHYGTGAIMAVPAHDQRDFDFAKKYNLPIIEVIKPEIKSKSLKKRVPLQITSRLREGAFEGEGVLIHSGRFDGMPSVDAKQRIGEWLAKKGLAKKAVNFRLRDWLVSRQRYWGAPIPMIFCQNCGWQPVREKDLPVILPRIRDFRPTGEGRSPLARSEGFMKTFCPKCGGPAKRETDTLDTFVCSSWYFLRYTDPRNANRFALKEKMKAWLPVNLYVGGTEHTLLHLLYSRFFTKALSKLNLVHFSEPFLSVRHQGTILGPDGQKMSKSRGNVIEPSQQVKKYGSDAVRMYLCFMGPYNQGGPWNPKGIIGIYRFLNRVWQLVTKCKIQNANFKFKTPQNDNDKNLEKLLHKTIKKVTEDIENFKFNTAISALMILVNKMQSTGSELNPGLIRKLLLLLAPFAPHLTEELWRRQVTKVKISKFEARYSIHNQVWPKYDPRLAKPEIITLLIQVNGKVRDKIEVTAGISQQEIKRLALSCQKVQKWIEGKAIKIIIFVPEKLINIVI